MANGLAFRIHNQHAGKAIAFDDNFSGGYTMIPLRGMKAE
jgi:hypothetical protein